MNTGKEKAMRQVPKGLFHLEVRDSIYSTAPIRTKCRKVDIIIHRLRMGHVGVKSHQFRFSLSDIKQCDYCEEDETIEHYLLKCEEYFTQRYELLNDIRCIFCPDDIPDITVRLLLGGEPSQ